MRPPRKVASLASLGYPPLRPSLSSPGSPSLRDNKKTQRRLILILFAFPSQSYSPLPPPLFPLYPGHSTPPFPPHPFLTLPYLPPSPPYISTTSPSDPPPSRQRLTAPCLSFFQLKTLSADLFKNNNICSTFVFFFSSDQYLLDSSSFRHRDNL